MGAGLVARNTSESHQLKAGTDNLIRRLLHKPNFGTEKSQHAELVRGALTVRLDEAVLSNETELSEKAAH